MGDKWRNVPPPPGAGRFRLFKMCLYIKDNFLLNLVPLYTTVFKNIVSVNFGGEFNSRVIKMYLPWFTYVPQRENVTCVAFPNSWLEDGFAYLIHASRQGKLLLS